MDNVAEFVGDFFITTLKDRFDGICGGILVYAKGWSHPNDFVFFIYVNELLYALVQKVG